MKKRGFLIRKLCNSLILLVLISMVMTLPISSKNTKAEIVDRMGVSHSFDYQPNFYNIAAQNISLDNVHYYKNWQELPIYKTDEFYDLYFTDANAYTSYDAPSSPLYPNEYRKDSIGEYVYGNCTWYCWSRGSEMLIRNGKAGLPKTGPAPSRWISLFGGTYGYRYSTSTSAQPESNSIAVYQGHVRYIDYVDGDVLIYSESGYRDTKKHDQWNGGIPTWLCYEVGTATKNADGSWTGHGNWDFYTFTVGKGSGNAKLLGYIYLDVPAVSLEEDNDGWSEVKTSTTKPIESEDLRIVKTETKYNYYHYCCNYYNGKNNVDSISYGSGSHHYHTLVSTSKLSASNVGDKGGKTLYQGSKCSCGFQVWAQADNFESTVYYYQEREHIHSYTTTIITPTCTSGGYTIYACEQCGDSYVADEIAAPGHTEVIDVAVAPTCTQTGLTAGKHCSVCNETIVGQQVMSMLPHTYDDVYDRQCNSCGYLRECDHITLINLPAVEPSCTQTGLTAGKYCATCLEILLEQKIIPVLEHSWSNWIIVKEPQCQEAGLNQRYCTVCYYTESQLIEACGHIEIITEELPATCANTGLTKGKYCGKCGNVLVAQETTPALGHSFTNYVSNHDATYTEDGTKTAKCGRCDVTDIVVDIGSALGMAQKFRDEMTELNANGDTKTTYAELYAILQTYSTLSAEEKTEVAKEFATLQPMIDAYNAKAETANNELAEATEVTFAPIATTSFAFLAALWFILRKKFLI